MSQNVSIEIPLEPVAPPLRGEPDGTVRVGTSRITLDVILREIDRGLTVQEIATEFESLSLADIHSIFAYYLRHPVESQAYLERRDREALEIRRVIEARQGRLPTKAELLARRGTQTHAEVDQR